MKKLIFLSLFIFCIFSTNRLFSQKVKATDSEVKIKKEDRSAISIVSEAEIKSLQKSWANFLKKNYKAKIKSGKNSVISNAVLVPTISIKAINIYSYFKEHENGSEFIIAAEIDSVDFISLKNYPDEFKSLKSFSVDFITNFLKLQYSKLIKEKQKAVNKSVKEELKMQKKINSLERSISKDSDKIQNLQKRIEQSKIEIEKSKAILPELNKKTEEKRIILKELEKRKEKL